MLATLKLKEHDDDDRPRLEGDHPNKAQLCKL